MKRALVLVPVAVVIVAAWILAWRTEPVVATVGGVGVPEASLQANLGALSDRKPSIAMLATCLAGINDPSLQPQQGASTAIAGAGAGTVETTVAQGEVRLLVAEAEGRHLLAVKHLAISADDMAAAREDLAGVLSQSCQGVADGSQALGQLPPAFLGNEVAFTAMEYQLIATYGHVDISPAGLHAYFAADPDHFTQFDQYCLSAIIVPSQAQAQSLHDQITAGASFAQEATQYSQDPTSASNGGVVQCYSASQLQQGQLSGDPTVAQFSQLLGQLGSPGQVSDPQQTSANGTTGWVIAEFNVTPPQFNASMVRSVALGAQSQVLSSVLGGALRRVTVTVDPRFGSWAPSLAGIQLPASPAPRFVLNAGADRPVQDGGQAGLGLGG